MIDTQAPTPNRILRSIWLKACITIAAALLASCSLLELEHVSTYRSIQDEFSGAAALENQHKLEVISATDLEANIRERQNTFKSPIRLAQAEALHHRYYQIVLSVSALLNRAESELVADGLAVNALSLRVMAQWRMAFFGQLVAILRGAAVQEPEEGQATEQPPAQSLSSVVTLAISTQQTIAKLREAQDSLPPYPRDEFVLRAIANGSLIRYDIAYIRALRAFRSDQASRETLLPLADQMAKAESELVGTKALPPHLLSYVAASRLLMLSVADSICVKQSIDYSASGMNTKLPNLIPRLRAAFKQFNEAGDPAGLRAALKAIGMGTKLERLLTNPSLE